MLERNHARRYRLVGELNIEGHMVACHIAVQTVLAGVSSQATSIVSGLDGCSSGVEHLLCGMVKAAGLSSFSSGHACRRK